MITRKRLSAGLVFVLAFIALCAVTMVDAAPVDQPGAPQAATVQAVSAWAMSGSEVITGTDESVTEYFTLPTASTGNNEVNRVRYYNAFDLFATVDVSGAISAVFTPQVSADGVNWTDADYTYVMSGTLQSGTYAMTLSADGTDYVLVPMAGMYARVKAVATFTGSGTLTPTLTMVPRNN